MEEPLGAFGGADREIGPRHVADEQRIAGQQQLAVDEQRAVLGSVSRGVDDADGDSTDRDLLTVGERVELVLGLGQRMDRDACTLLEREPAVAGDVVGVVVRLEHARDPQPAAFGDGDQLLDRVRRVDDDRLAASSSPIRYEAQPSALSRICSKTTAASVRAKLASFELS